MMKKLSCGVTLATIAAAFLIVSGATAISQQGQSGIPPSSKQSKGKMPKHQQGMMGMSAMKQEPHHVLAMAYQDNLVNFAKALRHHAAEAKTVNPEFARAAVAEMKRSFDQMQEHHQEHMKTMDEKMKAQMADMMKQMDAHHSAIREHLAALDKEVQTSAPDAKGVSEHVAEILKQCEGMSKMHGGTMEHKMAAPKEHKMD
jgi:polyhydroxyalkanoate synthesis regulator phasin